MTSREGSELGPPGIHEVVMARSAAQKIKQISAEQHFRLDQGGFVLTLRDDPICRLEGTSQHAQDGRDRLSKSKTSRSDQDNLDIVNLETRSADRLGDGHILRSRKPTITTASSGVTEQHSESDLENGWPRRRRLTTTSRPPKSVSSGNEPSMHREIKNTHRLDPLKRFEHWRVEEIIRRTFEECLTESAYDREFCCRMSRILADLIKERVKSLQFVRYKIVSVVSIGQRTRQSLQMTSRFVWNAGFDCYAHCVFEKGDLYAVGVVYGIYCE
ncbi:dynein light chain Tctex-type 5-A-like [Acropora muricata]|uniref:dynein light chain Tctex-type 5-A-like n=1 Tax=Acropora millepora TaxID=45264 RepID=UPI001CF1B5BD|nr:dynein light chain Tctex-type 5-A-like [Acropora millepora]